MKRASVAAQTTFKKVSHVIFDMDGLLLDTETIYTQATNNILQEYGKTLDWSTKSHLMGLTGEESAKEIIKLLDLPLTWEEYYSLAQEQYQLLMPHAELMPDTEQIYKTVITGIAKEHGKVYTTEMRMKLLGGPDTTAADVCINDMQLPMSREQFLEQFRNRSKVLLSSCAIMPGAENLVRHFHRNNIPIAVATSSTKASTDLKTANYQDLFSLFSHIVTGGSDPEVKHGKPSPDIFLICASRFRDEPQPEKCLAFEDSPNGVMAAIAARMQCIMVPDPHTMPELTNQATQVLKSLEEMKPECFGLPPL